MGMEAGLDAGDPPGLPVSQAKKRTLEELFKPPLDLMHQGDWQSARDVATSSGRWLLVNIQDSREFQCQVLNRDLWSNPAVKTIIQEHFVFWQQYKESDEAERYMTFYQIDSWPYVAVIDPRTGEKMVTWSKIDATAFPELMTEFLSLHPNLESPAKEPPRKKARTGTILEQDEEAQMEAAIRASLQETLATRDDEDDDIETFSDEDSNLSVRVNGDKSEDVVTNGNDRLGDKEEDDDHDDDTDWENYLGADTDPVANIMIRFPDGSRDNWKQPGSSRLKALVLYVRGKGFSLEDHEIVTNFPGRVITDLNLMDTVKEAGLFPQETVFVQLKTRIKRRYHIGAVIDLKEMNLCPPNLNLCNK